MRGQAFSFYFFEAQILASVRTTRLSKSQTTILALPKNKGLSYNRNTMEIDPKIAELEHIRHSLAHLLAAAVLKEFPDAKLGIGPVIESGFYYDFELPRSIAPDDLGTFEKTMRKLATEHLSFVEKKVSANEAKNIFKNQPFKLELIKELEEKGEDITIYITGEIGLRESASSPQKSAFMDLCRGKHVENTKEIPTDAFKLDKIAGAYWRGDEKNPMLQRIYGLAFTSKEELEEYLKLLEEAKKRDHKKLGKELDLFVFSDLIGPGLPIYTFKGAAIRREIINFSDELQKEIGYREVHTPNINKADLFKVSGHYEKYKADMLRVTSNYTKEEYYLKPMNCPQHTQVYASHLRSYKDLPIRIADFANLYRDEKPGELSGLTRLRAFSQDDGHCFCRPDQIKEEFRSVLGVIKKALAVYKMDCYIRLSLWDPAQPEKYLGEPAIWEKSQTILKEILEENKLAYIIGVGEAAIYGPKMDVITKDSLGREWQISTIQLDLIMPNRFGLTYIDQDGSEKTPIMIHRALIGSPERFMGVLIEHYAGNFPVWLAPTQVAVVPVSEKTLKYGKEIYGRLLTKNIRTEWSEPTESLGKRIRAAEMMKIPYILVIGEKEEREGMVNMRSRKDGTTSEPKNAEEIEIKLEKFIEKVERETRERTR